jgi:hypothetical protein
MRESFGPLDIGNVAGARDLDELRTIQLIGIGRRSNVALAHLRNSTCSLSVRSCISAAASAAQGCFVSCITASNSSEDNTFANVAAPG